MITINKLLARRLRSVFGPVLKAKANATSPVLLQASVDGLRVQARSPIAAVAYHDPGNYPAAELMVPFSLLKVIEGAKAHSVTLEPAKGNRITASWQDEAIPRSITVDVREPTGDDPVFPVTPTSWVENDPDIVQAFTAAIATTDQFSSRYALSCLQLRGRDGAIIATDGRQALKQTGFDLPFEEELLIHGTKVFSCKELASL